MAHAEAIERLVRRVSMQVRWRRAEHHALRGAFYGTLAAVLALVFKTPLGLRALLVAGGLLLLGLVGGVLWGLSRRDRKSVV